MTEAMIECKITEGFKQGASLADYYDSITTMGIDFTKTPKNDLLLTLLYEAMLKTNDIGLQNQQKLMVNKTESFKRKRNTKRNKVGVLANYLSLLQIKTTLEKGLCKVSGR